MGGGMHNAPPPDTPPATGEWGEYSDADAARVRALDIPALIVFALLFFTVALQFFTRYVLNDSLGWTEEIARYLLILLAFSGGILCVRNNAHIALEFFHRYLPPAVSARVWSGCRLITAAFFLYCGVLAVQLAQRTSSSMASVDLPKAVIYYIVALMCALTGALALAALRQRGKGGGNTDST